MDDLSSIFGSQEKGKDLVDKLVHLLDRQTDHKLTPHLLLGFLGMFNVLSIMTVVHSNGEIGVKEVSSQAETTDTGSNQSLMDTLGGLLKNQGTGGQPDLMGLLSSLASKKKINPNLLLSLFSMLNNQTGQAVQQPDNEPVPEAASLSKAVEKEGGAEKKTPDDKNGVELKYDRKRGAGERA